MKRIILSALVMLLGLSLSGQDNHLPIRFDFDCPEYGGGMLFDFDGKTKTFDDKPVFRAIYDGEDYILRMNLPMPLEQEFYYIIRPEDKLIFKTSANDIIMLPLMKEYGVIHTKHNESLLFGLLNTVTYITQIHFLIEDYDALMNSTITKVRIFKDGAACDYSLTGMRRVDEFNESLRTSCKQAKELYFKLIESEKKKEETADKLKNNPAHGL